MMIPGEEVFNKLAEDPRTAALLPGPQLEMMRPYILALPELLEDLLSQQFTLTVLVEAQSRFIRSLIEGGFIDQLARVVPDLAGMLDTAKGLYDEMYENLLAILKDTPAFLEEYGISEEDILLRNPRQSLNPQLADLYRCQLLLLEDVLRCQPAMIVANGR